LVLAPCKSPQIKAIQIEVDSRATKNHSEQISNVCSAKTKEFPAGIKMQLVAKISHLTNDKVCHEQLQAPSLLSGYIQHMIATGSPAPKL